LIENRRNRGGAKSRQKLNFGHESAVHQMAHIEAADLLKACESGPTAPPCGFSFRHVANSIPGGLETIIVLAWLSSHPQVRAIAGSWSSLPRKAKQGVELEELCLAAGIDAGSFFGSIVATAFELEMDISGFIGGALQMSVQATRFVEHVRTRKRARLRKQFFKSAAFWAGVAPVPEPVKISLAGVLSGRSRGSNRRISRGRQVVSGEGRTGCDEMAAIRRKWKLSLRQFAELFLTSARTVRRWEGREFNPTPHQHWCLSILVRYAEQKGITAFRRRFVQQPGRYSKPGRPPSLNSN
jgi:DNA-binding transcriptional regulator YiaG